MIITNQMYLRPGNFLREFVVEASIEELDARGRAVTSYDESGDKRFKGVIADSTDKEIARYEQRGHPVTHTIVSFDTPKAKPTDKLILDERIFIVKGVDNANTINFATIYHVEERTDID